MMLKRIKIKLYILVFALLVVFWSVIPFRQQVFWAAPEYDDYLETLEWFVHDRWNVDKDRNLKYNIIQLFYPNPWAEGNRIFDVIRNMTLGLMIIFIVWSWASLLINKDSKDLSKSMSSLLYIVLWWVFIFWANRLFWIVLNFNEAEVTYSWAGVWWVRTALIWEDSVLFRVLSAVKVAAFFLAIIMIVVTWFKVISAWEWEKWKTLVKWLINVVVALLIIKWVDFIYYMAADGHFVDRASTFIIDVAKLFGYLYGIVIVIMVFVAGYLYITDWGSWDWFKKASNLLVNILLSALVLFSFLLIVYQIFAEFRTWWDAVTDLPAPLSFVLSNEASLA